MYSGYYYIGVLNDENNLTHHGIKGMKWGVRRFQNPDGTLTEAGKKRQEQKRTKNENKKEVKRRRNVLRNRRILSDKDLEKEIHRLQLEKQLKDLERNDVRSGQQFVNNVLKQVGTKVVTGALVGATAYGLKAALTKDFNIKEAANFMFPNPNKKK